MKTEQIIRNRHKDTNYDVELTNIKNKTMTLFSIKNPENLGF